MGLIKAAAGAVGGVMADQWKDFIYCDSIPANVLVMKGRKRISSRGRSSNTSGEDNIISNGSVVAINNGQCMIIVESGKVVEICAEPGQYTYDKSSQPSVFAGNLADSVKDVFREIGKRFTFGGDTGADQRVYFFNTKEIIGNKYGTPSTIAFKVVDMELGFKRIMSLKCFGEYSYRICNPILFYTNVCGNVEPEYQRSELDSQLKSELLTALQPAFAKLSAQRVEYDEILAHTSELADYLNAELSRKWRELRGIEIVSFGINSVKASDEDEAALKKYQERATLVNPNMRNAYMAGGMTDGFENNDNGAGAGFMGMGFAQMGMGMMQGMNAPQQNYQQAPQQNTFGNRTQSQAGGNSWKCTCGHVNTGNFCMECGSKKPLPSSANGWTCSCGTVNQGKFCMNCGTKKPAAAPLYRCDKCGWRPADPAKPPKFCPECGDIFNDNDIVQ